MSGNTQLPAKVPISNPSKMPKASAPRAAAEQRRPLADEILSQGHLRTKSGKRKSRSDEADDDHYLDAKTSKKILQIGQELADEDEAETRAAAAAKGKSVNTAFDFESRFGVEDGSEEEDNDKFAEDEWGDEEEEEVEEIVRIFIPLRGHEAEDSPIAECGC